MYQIHVSNSCTKNRINILDHPTPSSSRHVCAPFAGSIHGADAPFAGARAAFCLSRRRIRWGAGPRGPPSALDRLASPRPRLANYLRPCLYGVPNRDLALLPTAVALHPQVEVVEAGRRLPLPASGLLWHWQIRHMA